MSLVLLFHYLLLSMFRTLVHPSSAACELLWIYFMCCIAVVRCVLVLRCGSAGVEWYPYVGFSVTVYFTPKNSYAQLYPCCTYWLRVFLGMCVEEGSALL